MDVPEYIKAKYDMNKTAACDAMDHLIHVLQSLSCEAKAVRQKYEDEPRVFLDFTAELLPRVAEAVGIVQKSALEQAIDKGNLLYFYNIKKEEL